MGMRYLKWVERLFVFKIFFLFYFYRRMIRWLNYLRVSIELMYVWDSIVKIFIDLELVFNFSISLYIFIKKKLFYIYVEWLEILLIYL